MADAPAPAPELKVAEIREDGTVIVEMEDGRMFPAEGKEGLQLRKGAVVTITSEGEDKGGAPLNAKIARIK